MANLIATRLNEKNGFTVARIHYSVDREKSTAEWITKEKKGMSEERWAREMEIDWSAAGGKLVFPFFHQFKDKIVVALFGGSTTLDFSNRNGESWGDLLQRSLGDRYAVVNHGAPGYTTAEHVIQTAFYQDAFGVSPHCSVYYVGWNDLTNAHIEGLDPGYANYHMPGQIDFLDARRLGPPLFSISPMLKLLSRFVAIAFDTARPAGAPPGHVASGADPVLDEIYLRNIRTISAINRQRGFATLWVDQVMNPERVSSRTMRGWIPFVPPQDTPTLFVHFNKLLQREAASLGDTYANIPEAVFTDRDFIDEGHFSPSGARKFAAQLFHAVMSACPR